jgi:hypothetical protein
VVDDLPFSGARVGKLYKPPFGDRFAGRQTWRLGYASQRLSREDRPFEAARRIQRKLGCDEGWGGVLIRPKGCTTQPSRAIWTAT